MSLAYRSRNFNVYEQQRAASAGLQRSIETCTQMSCHLAFLRRLGLQNVLSGHDGCVNSLAWNEEGSLLVTGSDDRQAILWNYPRGNAVQSLATGHSYNVFAATLLPRTNDSIMITGAGDGEVRLHFLHRQPPTTAIFSGHRGRVKRLAVEPANPWLFFSASEDATVRQYDRRCQGDGNIIVDLANSDWRSNLPDTFRNWRMFGLRSGPQIKTMAVNGQMPQYIAVGCGDPFVRIYDRRMLEGSGSHSLPELVCSPATLARDTAAPNYEGGAYVTHTAFSPCGKQLLASYGGNQIYLFDILGSKTPFVFREPSLPTTARQKPPAGVQRKNNLGNLAFKKALWSQAIYYYSEALLSARNVSNVYSNRAAALLKRDWAGDGLLACRDGQAAVELNCDNRKGYLWWGRALIGQRRFQMAKKVAEMGLARFPADRSLQHLEQTIEDESKRELDSERKRETHDSQPVATEEDKVIGGSSETANYSTFDASVLDQCNAGDDVDETLLTVRVPGGGKGAKQPYVDMTSRYCGHCNTDTDIKEANFWGAAGQCIVSGSDCGHIYIWDKATTQLLGALKADRFIANCVQPHPTDMCLATSGIENDVRLWCPVVSRDSKLITSAVELTQLSATNQAKMDRDDVITADLMSAFSNRLANSQNGDDESNCIVS